MASPTLSTLRPSCWKKLRIDKGCLKGRLASLILDSALYGDPNTLRLSNRKIQKLLFA